MQNKKKLKAGLGILMAVGMFAAIFLLLGKLSFIKDDSIEDTQTINIVADEQDAMGISLSSMFTIKTSGELTAADLKRGLNIQPSFSYALAIKDSAHEYSIIPSAPLLPDTIYSFSFDLNGKKQEKLSWAFQTKGSFKVLGSMPAQRSTDVPIDSGIEIYFSHANFDLKQIEKYFQISPETKGSFEQNKRSLVFVPEKLQAGTYYRVTVKKGLPMLGSDELLAEDHHFVFETSRDTEGKDKFSFDISNVLHEFAVGEEPVFDAYFDYRFIQGENSAQEIKNMEIEVTVYVFKDGEHFASSLAQKEEYPEWTYMSREYRTDISSLQKAAEFKTNFLTLNEYSHYLIFPHSLPAGYYVADIKVGDHVRQVWMQITDLATYAAIGRQNTLIWVNDLAKKQPLEKAKVEVLGQKIEAITDQGGAVLIKPVFSANEENDALYARVSGEGKETIIPLMQNNLYYSWWDDSKAQKYWKYLYLEREIFKPGDELNYWGILGSRENGLENLNEVRVELWSSRRSYYGEESSPILIQNVPVQDKIFSGKIDLPVLKPDYYYLRLCIGETTLLSKGFSVETYTKPAYQLELNPEKKAIFAGEKISFELRASFYEGTPLPDLAVNYETYDKNGQTVTNENGSSKISYIGETISEEYYNPYRYRYMHVRASLPEAAEISASESILVFNSKLYIKGEAKRQADGFRLEGEVYDIELESINSGASVEEKNYLAAPAANVLIRGSIHQNVWEKVEAGQRYDYINKKVVTDYYYNHSTKHIKDFEVTSGEKGSIFYESGLDEKSSYYVLLTAQDSSGRMAKSRIEIPSAESGEWDDYKYYHLKGSKEGQRYAEEEAVNLFFMENELQLIEKTNAFLYYRGQDEINAYEVSDSPEHKFIFNAKDKPNLNAFGVFFDGNAYHETPGYIVAFEREKQRLQVEISTDKAEYGPGEQVIASINIKDLNGEPVTAEINLNLVDEAIFDLAEQNVDIITSLYGDFIYMPLNTRKSHYQSSFGGGAEKGGEGGSDRKDFRDTIIFISLKTDAQGKAQTNFKLPDNITSWRLTYHVLSSDLKAASGTKKISAKLPFFVDLVAKDKYLTGDSPIVILRGYGEGLGANDRITYKYTLSDTEGKTFTGTASADAYSSLDWQLPKLKPGKYGLKVEGNVKDHKDSISMSFTVEDSFLEWTKSFDAHLDESFRLEQLLKDFSEESEPIEIIFCDSQESKYIRGLHLLSGQNGIRFEQKMAAQIGLDLMQEYFPETLHNVIAEQPADDLLRYQREDGGVAILPYAESDLELTALAASLIAEKLDKDAMAAYMYRMLEEEKEIDRSAALWGLGALREPVLLQVEQMLKEDDLSLAENINLALAMLDLGNGHTAEVMCNDLIIKHGEDLGAVMRINVGEDQDDVIMATSRVAMLASRLDHPQKDKLYQYLLDNPGEKVLNVAEQAIILTHNLYNMDPEPVSFAYTNEGQKVTKELSGGESFRLILLPQEASRISFMDIQGDVGVMVLYSSPYKPEEITKDPDLFIKKIYKVENIEREMLNRSDLVEVNLEFEIKDKAPSGNYEIIDFLPAGLRYVALENTDLKYMNRDIAYPTQVKGQAIHFVVNKDDKKLIYYARPVNPGEYKAEAALLFNVRNDQVSTYGTEKWIEIK